MYIIPALLELFDLILTIVMRLSRSGYFSCCYLMKVSKEYFLFVLFFISLFFYFYVMFDFSFLVKGVTADFNSGFLTEV